ncbi:hypothetical protein QYE76_020874 [Lolium multiflorum]|uniref:RNase H type-1 domain-containing protein n=1 Tax=Lolium multiflorum TaxID=4521 RepID=A0AAD8R7Y2_LOLMU|nr:hypothetical protein QYE76_020874 [Lolium multiflorum]
MDLVAKSDILNKPITPEEGRPGGLRSQTAGDAGNSSKFARTAAAMAEERTLAANFVDYSLKKDREVDEMMATAKGLRIEWQKSRNQDREHEPRRNQEQSLSLVGIKNATTSLAKPRTRSGTKRSRNEEYARHAGAEAEATTTKRKGATEAGASQAHATSPGGRSSYRPPRISLTTTKWRRRWRRRPEIRSRSKSPGGAPRDARDRLNEYRSDYIGPSIKLPVAFGNVNNYREEMITFEVVPFKSSYHVIFGRPTYHKFHARACYIYNKLKIPGPNGWITVSRDYKKARDCEEGEAAFAESVISGEELQGYGPRWIRRDAETTRSVSEQKTSFKAAIETKKHDLVEGDSSKQIGPEGTPVEAWVMHLTDPSNIKARGQVTLKSPPEKNYRSDSLRSNQQYGGIRGSTTLRIAKEIGIKHIICCGDSDLVAQQVAGTWNARNSVMAAYKDEVDEIAKCFLGYEVKYVRRDDNTRRHAVQARIRQKPIPRNFP